MKVEDQYMESSPGNNKTNKKKFDKIGQQNLEKLAFFQRWVKS